MREQSKSGRISFWAEERVSEKALSCVRNTKRPNMVRAQRTKRSVHPCGEELRRRPGYEGLVHQARKCLVFNIILVAGRLHVTCVRKRGAKGKSKSFG